MLTAANTLTNSSYEYLLVTLSVLLTASGVYIVRDLARRVRASRGDFGERKQAQERLREYEKAVEGLEEMIVVVDREYRYVLVNRAFLNYRALEREQIIGRTVPEMVNRNVFETVIKEKLDECFRGKVVTFEMKYEYSRLGPRDLSLSYFPIEGPRGVERVACVFQDITERKRAEDELRQAQIRTESVLESVTDIHILYDRGWRYLYVNRAAVQTIGRPREQILGRTFWELYPDVVGTELERQCRRAMEERIPVACVYHYPATNNWWEVRFYPVPEGLSAFGTNITERKRGEEALLRLAAIVESTDDAIISKDLNGVILSWNAGAQRIFGYTEGEVLGQPISVIIPPELWNEETQILRRLRAGEHIQHYETIRLTKHGRRVNVSLTISPMMDSEGRIVGASKISRDITEGKRAEEALRESEDRYRDLVEHSQDLLCTHDLEGKLLSVNPAPARILGYEAAELLKIPMREFIAPEFREQFEAYLARIRTTGVDKGVMAVVTRTGERRIWEYHNTLRTGGVPSPIVRGMAHDITERKRAEKSLQLFRMLIDQSNDAIEVVDPETLRFLDINGRACLDLGYSREEFLSLRVCDIDPNVDESMFARVGEELQNSGSAIFESLHRRKDGSTYPVEISVKKVHLDRIYTVSVARDITERKRAEQALRESQATLARVRRIAALGELSASIAHEINQPLAAVATNASAALRWLAIQPPNLDETREAVSRAIEEANRASGVIERVRALVQKAKPELRPLNGNEAIRQVLLLAESELLRGGVTVKTELATDLPTVLGDHIQVQQVMLNLILNAIDAMSVNTGLRELLIKSSKHPEGVLVRVEDSGKGIDPEHADRIFEPFFTTKQGGVGLGLSISRSIVEAHGGRLWHTSRSPSGAIFQFTLPTTGGEA